MGSVEKKGYLCSSLKITVALMEKFADLIQKRRTTRRFTKEELSQDDVVVLLKAALMSPSSKKVNDWQFVIVDDKELLRQLSQCKEHGSESIASAPLAIVVLGNPLLSDVWIENAAIASLMIQLQAEDLGLGSCWVQVRERYSANGTPADEIVRSLLDIPQMLQVLSIIAVGHKIVERKPFNDVDLQWEKVHINRYVTKAENN